MAFLRQICIVVLLPIVAGVSIANVPVSAFNKDPWPAVKEGSCPTFASMIRIFAWWRGWALCRSPVYT